MSDDCKDPQLDQREPGALPEPEEVLPETPDGSAPEPTNPGIGYIQRGTIRDLICRIGSLQPQILNGIFMNLLADHFSSPLQVMEGKLKRYGYRQDETSDIKIMTSTQWNGVDRSNDPLTIVLIRREQRYTPIGIGGRGEAEIDGQLMHYMIDGGHTFVAAGGSGAEAELLGEEIARIWSHEAYRMTQDFMFHTFQPGSVGELGTVEELGQTIGVPISITYSYESITKVQPISPAAKVFNAGITLQN